jgi:probable F420-dependent oxidoreductase
MYDNLKLATDIQCGMVIPREGRAEALDYARRIEAAGFDSLWVGDHISFHIPILESLTLLSFVAAVTERIRLGTAIYLLPLRHPTITAKVTSTLDVLSGGRFTMGIGVGGEFPPEFEACGIPLEERGSRTDEGIQVLRRLWSEDKVEHRGRHFSFGPVTLSPKPLQAGGPPILIGGRKAPTFRRAGQLGNGYISHMCAVEHFVENMKLIDGHAGEAGRGPLEFETAGYFFTFPDDSYDRALDRAAAMLERIYNRPFRDAARKYCLLGRPENFLEQMQSFVDVGARRFIFAVPDDPSGFIDIYQRKIRPRLGELKIPG